VRQYHRKRKRLEREIRVFGAHRISKRLPTATMRSRAQIQAVWRPRGREKKGEVEREVRATCRHGNASKEEGIKGELKREDRGVSDSVTGVNFTGGRRRCRR
jgi:hypothetical protein